MENLGKLFYGLIAIVIVSIVNAYVLSKLWAWILVPSFNLPEITMGVAFGLSVFIAFFRTKNSKTDEEDDVVEKLTKTIAWVLINGATYLLIGWIAGMFI